MASSTAPADQIIDLIPMCKNIVTVLSLSLFFFLKSFSNLSALLHLVSVEVPGVVTSRTRNTAGLVATNLLLEETNLLVKLSHDPLILFFDGPLRFSPGPLSQKPLVVFSPSNTCTLTMIPMDWPTERLARFIAVPNGGTSTAPFG